MDAFDKIVKATPSGGGNYIEDGHYPRLRVEKLTLQNGHTGTCFIAELRVVDAPTPIVAGVEPNKHGSTMSFVANLTKHESAAGNVKAFMLGVLGGLGITDFDSKTLREACSEANPLRGFDVEMTTYRKTIKSGKNAGQPITLPKWAVIEQTKEGIKAQRAALAERPAPAAAVASEPTHAPASQPAGGGLLASIGIE